MNDNARITPCLWFDGQAEEAARFYTSVFPNSKIGAIARYSAEAARLAGNEEGAVLTVEIELNGNPFLALNGGPEFRFNEAISFIVPCETQQDVDYYWTRLTERGGQPSRCGWLKDRFGVSWQIVPAEFSRMMRDPDEQKRRRVIDAVMQMDKLDIAALRRAYDQ